MSNSQSDSQPSSSLGREFTTTHWSVVLIAGGAASGAADSALEHLCRTYWYPLYAYVRRQGHSESDAQDLTQSFFARLLERKYLRLADRNQGRFRTFLLTSLKHFLINDWKKENREKRGGGQKTLSSTKKWPNHVLPPNPPSRSRLTPYMTGAGPRFCWNALWRH